MLLLLLLLLLLMVLIVTLLEKILVVEHLEQENEYFANRKAIEIDFFTLDLFENADEASKSQGKASFSVVQHHRGVVLRLEEVPAPTTTRPKSRRVGPLAGRQHLVRTTKLAAAAASCTSSTGKSCRDDDGGGS